MQIKPAIYLLVPRQIRVGWVRVHSPWRLFDWLNRKRLISELFPFRWH
jgi:hypothetical protein